MTRKQSENPVISPILIIIGVILILFMIGSGYYLFTYYSTVFESIGIPYENQPVNLSFEEKLWITEHPVVYVCPDSNYPPFEMVLGTGTYEGISADLLREICKNTGLILQVVYDPDWNNCVQKIQQGKADILGAVYISNLRSGYLLYSEPYYHSLLPIITRDDSIKDITLDQLSGKKVASVKGFTTTLLLQTKYPDVDVIEVQNVKSGLESVSLGSADAYFGDLAASSWYVDKEGYSNLHVAGAYTPENADDFSYAFGVRKDYPILVQIINKGYHAIPKEKREEIFRNWISPSLTKPAINPMYLLITCVIVASLLLLSLLFLFWNHTLKKVVEEKTQNLTIELRKHKQTSERLMMNRQAVDHSKALVLWLDESGLIVDINETASRYIGLGREDIIGREIFTIVDYFSKEKIAGTLQEAKERGYVSIEHIFSMKDKDPIPAEFVVWFFTYDKTGIFCIEIHDISERYHNQQSLRESEQNYRDLFNNVNDAIFLFDVGDDHSLGALLEVNEVAEALTAYSRSELIRMTYDMLGTSPHPPVDDECITIRCLCEWEIMAKNGKKIPVEENIHFFRRDGRILGLALLKDITEIKIFEAERQAAIAQIQKNMIELSILNDGIRNPLTVILALAESFCPDQFEAIEMQVNQIDLTIDQLDFRWNESEKILSYLKKHHGFDMNYDK